MSLPLCPFLFSTHCFEAAELTLTYNEQLINFCIYRPPPSKNNRFSDSCFSVSFPTFVNTHDSLHGTTLLFGDLNSNSRKLHEITVFNLTQSVFEPTHNQGHLPDLVFSQQSDNILISTKLHLD